MTPSAETATGSRREEAPDDDGPPGIRNGAGKGERREAGRAATPTPPQPMSEEEARRRLSAVEARRIARVGQVSRKACTGSFAEFECSGA